MVNILREAPRYARTFCKFRHEREFLRVIKVYGNKRVLALTARSQPGKGIIKFNISVINGIVTLCTVITFFVSNLLLCWGCSERNVFFIRKIAARKNRFEFSYFKIRESMDFQFEKKIMRPYCFFFFFFLKTLFRPLTFHVPASS